MLGVKREDRTDVSSVFSLLAFLSDSYFAGMWTIDPVDGTKGFLRGDQYAVCVSLIVDSEVKLGVIGCPNLPVDQDDPEGKRGCIFVAVKGLVRFAISFVSILKSCPHPFKLMVTRPH